MALERLPVGQMGQRVVTGLVAEALVQQPLLGGVGGDHQPLRAPFHVDAAGNHARPEHVAQHRRQFGLTGEGAAAILIRHQVQQLRRRHLRQLGQRGADA